MPINDPQSSEQSSATRAPAMGTASRFKRVAGVVLAIVAFAYLLARHIQRDGGSASMIFFVVGAAVILFLVIAPEKFQLVEKPRFDLTVGSDGSPNEAKSEGEAEPTHSQWRR